MCVRGGSITLWVMVGKRNHSQLYMHSHETFFPHGNFAYGGKLLKKQYVQNQWGILQEKSQQVLIVNKLSLH